MGRIFIIFVSRSVTWKSASASFSVNVTVLIPEFVTSFTASTPSPATVLPASGKSDAAAMITLPDAPVIVAIKVSIKLKIKLKYFFMLSYNLC